MSNNWPQLIQLLYPDLLQKTICVPPVYFQRVPYTKDSVADQSVLVLDQPPGVPTSNISSTSSQSPAASQSSTPSTSSTSSQSPAASQSSTPTTSSTSSQSTTQSHSAKPTKTLTAYKCKTPERQSFLDKQRAVYANQVASAVQTVICDLSGNKNTSINQFATAFQNIGLKQSPKGTPSASSATKSGQSSSACSSSTVAKASSGQSQNLQTQYSLWTKIKKIDLASVQDSDMRDDFAQHHVLANLQELGNQYNEVMVVLSQLSFGDYLHKSSYAAAVAACKLPRPSDLGKNYSEGDFDFLIIHRLYGILIGELKSVGRYSTVVNKTQAKADADVAKRVEKAAKQLDKSETVVKHLVSDVIPGIRVKKSIFLPYVSSGQLKRVLAAYPNVEQAVCQTLGASSAAEAARLCLCSDQLSDPTTYWDVKPVLSHLNTWWQHLMTCGVETRLDDLKYLEIISRFVGPATSVQVHCSLPPRVEVRTLGQAVSELGNRMALLVLTTQQIDLLTREPPRVWLIGSPGTGKTVMLILMALKWLRQGRDVHVISWFNGNAAVTRLIHHQLTMTLRSMGLNLSSPSMGSLYAYYFDCEKRPADILKAIHDIGVNISTGKDKHALIMDEGKFADKEALLFKEYGWFVNSLTSTAVASNVYAWVASVEEPVYNLPLGMQVEKLTVPLRSAPVIVREIQGVIGMFGNRIPYSDSHSSGIACSADGPKVIRLSHSGGSHQEVWPVDCPACGCDIANILNQLQIGSAGPANMPNSPKKLRYKDVFVLTRSNSLQDAVTNAAGTVTSPASGVVQGLRSKGVPVCVLGVNPPDLSTWEREVEDTALAHTNRVTVAHFRTVMGLERKVVVWLPARFTGYDEFQDDEMVDAKDRLDVVSRCTTQLVVVEMEIPKLEEPSLD